MLLIRGAASTRPRPAKVESISVSAIGWTRDSIRSMASSLVRSGTASLPRNPQAWPIALVSMAQRSSSPGESRLAMRTALPFATLRGSAIIDGFACTVFDGLPATASRLL